MDAFRRDPFYNVNGLQEVRALGTFGYGGGVTGWYGRCMESAVKHRLPVRSWLRNELKDMIGDLLSEKGVRERGLFHPNIVTRMIEENRAGTRDHTLQLWSLLTLELWQQTFIDAPVGISSVDAIFLFWRTLQVPDL